MKITTLKKYSQFESLGIFRDQVFTEFPYSKIVEGSTGELIMCVNWCLENIGKRNKKFIIGDDVNFRQIMKSSEKGLWVELWYGKVGYDYGISEFFFKDEVSLNSFLTAVPNFYALNEKNEKWKTNGINEDGNIVEFKL